MFEFTFKGDVGYRRVAILSRVNLQLGGGEGILLSGSNGSGKTTLLRTCAGLLHPLVGVARCNGQDTRTDAAKASIAHIGEPLSLFGELTVNEHAELATRLASHLMDTTYFRLLSDALGVTGFADTLVASLSAGQARRANLALVLARHPKLLLLDEVFNEFDKSALEAAITVLGAFQEQQGSLIVVSHRADIPRSLFTKFLHCEGNRLLTQHDDSSDAR